MFVRLAQLTAEIRSYSRDHSDYDVRICHILQKEFVAYNTTSADGSLIGENLEGPCGAAVPVETYYIAAATGLAQVCFFIISGPLTRWFGNKPLLGKYLK